MIVVGVIYFFEVGEGVVVVGVVFDIGVCFKAIGIGFDD